MVDDGELKCEICKIFGNENRLKILLILAKGEKTVTKILSATNISQSAVSQHLAMMKSKGVLKTRKVGSYIYYSIKYPQIMDAYKIMRSVTEKIRGAKNV
ncbi:MAG: metalloregulator ArsR/SmtB family transcription factor [Nanoarchaeota archaeon]|nr:metalloregulator ArsR/SmtB family transcription factor [Nanoarchaeota archaeon]